MPAEVLQRLREKYPEYDSVPDAKLAYLVIKKYPQYKNALGDIAASKGVSGAPIVSARAVSGSMAVPPKSASPFSNVQEKDVHKFTMDFLNTANPTANDPMKAAVALSKNPHDPAWLPRLRQMHPVSQAAIARKAQELSQGERFSYEYPPVSGGMGPVNPIIREKTTGRVVTPEEAGVKPLSRSLEEAFIGPEGAKELQTKKGFRASAAKFAYGMADPENAAIAGMITAMPELGLIAGPVFAGMSGKSAIEKWKAGDEGGALFDALAGLAAVSGSAAKGVKMARRFSIRGVQEAAVTPKELAVTGGESAPKGEISAALQSARVGVAAPSVLHAGEARQDTGGGGEGEVSPGQGQALADAQATRSGGKGRVGKGKKPSPGKAAQPKVGYAGDVEAAAALRPALGDRAEEGLAAAKAAVKGRTHPTSYDQLDAGGHVLRVYPSGDVRVIPEPGREPSAVGKAHNELRDKIFPGEVHPLERPGEVPLAAGYVPGALGEDTFWQKDLQPVLQTLREAPEQVKGALTSLFNPAGVSESAATTARSLRAGLGHMARVEEAARTYVKATRKAFTKILSAKGGAPVVNGVVQMDHPAVRFVRSVEKGLPLDPDLATHQSMADWMQSEMGKTWKKIQDLGVSDGFVENYWPHLWERPNKVTSYVRQMIGRKPLAGPESFKHGRTIPTFDEGLNKNLVPVTWNPIEQFMLKLHEMNRSIVAHESWDYLKKQGIPKFVRFGGEAPEGFVRVDDKIARAIEMRPTLKADGTPGAPEPILRGNWYLPKPSAKILNNYLSPGLRGNYIYDAMRGVGNTLNQAQLGMSGFHVTFVGLDAATSHTALGFEQLAQGRVKSAAKSIAQGLSFYGAPKSLVRGHMISKAYRNPSLDMSTPMGRIVDMLEKGGARAVQASEYSNRSIDSLRNAVERHNVLGAAVRIPGALYEWAAKLVMELYVPRMKLGVAEVMLKSEMERLGPNASESALTKAAQSVWDSVDNRMGQLVYDNLFWDNWLKHGGQLSTRSLGWNIGSVRELGGGGKDLMTTPWRVKAGDPVLTHRLAYAMALPLQMSLAGSLLYWAYNKKLPNNLRDMLQPIIDGDRWQLASYTREVIPLVQSLQGGLPGVTHEISKRAMSKLNPVLSSTWEFLTNEDYFGNPIYGEKGLGVLPFLANQFTPFSLRDFPGKATTREEEIRQVLGLTRTPRDRTMLEDIYGSGIRQLKTAKKAGYIPPSSKKSF